MMCIFGKWASWLLSWLLSLSLSTLLQGKEISLQGKEILVCVPNWHRQFRSASQMRSSALLDAFGGAICAAIAFPAGWWWCGVASIVVMLINLGVKAHEVSVSSSIARSVATHVPQLKQQRTEATKKNGWSGRKLLVLVNPNAGSNQF